MPVEVGNCLWALGRFLAVLEPTRAKELIDEALVSAVDFGTPSAIAYAWRERMRLSWGGSFEGHVNSLQGQGGYRLF